MLLRPAPRTTPTEWARKSRAYPPTSGRPGARDPSYTPYVIDFANALDSVSHGVICLVCGSQMGKTDAVLDMIGWRLDTKPRPQLYVGPSKAFLEDQLEPRVMALLDQAPTLKNKVARGKRMKKTRKLVAGVPLRMAWAGSPTQLSSDQAGDVHVDELDRMGSDVGGEGDPLTIVKARGFTFKDRKVVVTSTPGKGSIEAEKDPDSGLEFWKKADPRDIESPIWKLWQSGTRHHWAWPCPHCAEFFIPRFKDLRWPEKATAEEAQRLAWLQCPRPTCESLKIGEDHKANMNARGVYVAPGQRVEVDGTVIGAPPAALTRSLWVSGLASPFVTFGERASAWLEAAESGDPEQIQGVINTGFGELFSPGGGDAPEWTEVAALRQPYPFRDVPAGAVFLTCGVDVQKNRLVYVIRGWGARQESWLTEHGEIWGETEQDEVWADLAELIDSRVGGARIRLTFVDSGFRPGKTDVIPEHKVYEFCRQHARGVRACKGYGARNTPLSVKTLEVTPRGKTAKYGLELVRLDSDFFKSWIHQRIRWPEDQPGGWHLSADATEDYCRQIVSEARARLASGGHKWVRRSKQNHYLDAEALAYAAAYMVGVQRIPGPREIPKTAEAPPPVPVVHRPARRGPVRSNFMA